MQSRPQVDADNGTLHPMSHPVSLSGLIGGALGELSDSICLLLPDWAHIQCYPDLEGEWVLPRQLRGTYQM